MNGDWDGCSEGRLRPASPITSADVIVDTALPRHYALLIFGRENVMKSQRYTVWQSPCKEESEIHCLVKTL
jgi:hypothetical protein